MSAPETEPGRRLSDARVTAVTLGVLVGLVVGVLTAGFASFFVARYSAAKARAGWNLVPVVVAAVDIPENTVVTLDMIAQRQVPEQFVTSSVVRPESAASIVNRKVMVTLQAGDMMLWSQFDPRWSAGPSPPPSGGATPSSGPTSRPGAGASAERPGPARLLGVPRMMHQE
jgi:hypothetical protein